MTDLWNFMIHMAYTRKSFTQLHLKGIEGIENMKKIMDTLRKDAPSEIAGVKVTESKRLP